MRRPNIWVPETRNNFLDNIYFVYYSFTFFKGRKINIPRLYEERDKAIFCKSHIKEILLFPQPNPSLSKSILL